MSLECYHKLIEYNLTDYTYTGILYDPKPKMEAATYVESLYLQWSAWCGSENNYDETATQSCPQVSYNNQTKYN